MDELLTRMSVKILRSRAALTDFALAEGASGRVQTVNLHHLSLAMKSDEFRRVMDDAHRVTADGWPIVTMMNSLGRPVERVTGSDFLLDLLADPRSKRVRFALIGASPEVGDAWAILMRNHELNVVFREHGDRRDWRSIDLARDLTNAEANFLLVAVTPPFGEVLAQSIVDAGFAGVVIGVGGGVDMSVGAQHRAPMMFQRANLEWLFRLLQSPRRFARRYLIDSAPAVRKFLVPAIARIMFRKIKARAQ